MDGFFTYHKEMNYNIDYDLLHGAHNDTDLTTNATGHKRHQCIMVSALNCLHGSKLAPPRLPQFRECVQEYVNTVDVSQCLVWLSRYEEIIYQMKLPFAASDDDAPQVIVFYFSVLGASWEPLGW